MSDGEPAGSGSKGVGPEAGSDSDENTGQTTVVTRPQRPSGKRSRRGAVVDGEASVDHTEAADSATESKAAVTKNGEGTKTAKKKRSTQGLPNPFVFVWTYIQQVVAELRKVIWPNRKQMVTYTTVVLIFLAFMVALIGVVDFGLARLITLVFG